MFKFKKYFLNLTNIKQTSNESLFDILNLFLICLLFESRESKQNIYETLYNIDLENIEFLLLKVLFYRFTNLKLKKFFFRFKKNSKNKLK